MFWQFFHAGAICKLSYAGKTVYMWVSWNAQICPFAGPENVSVLKREHAAASFVALYGSFFAVKKRAFPSQST